MAARVVSGGLNRADTVEAVKQVAAKAQKGRGAKPKAKGKPSKPDRLPPEIKHRDPNGCRVIVQTAARHTMADVVAALRAFADRLEIESRRRESDAA